MLTDGRTDRRTEWGIAIALSQIGWLGAKKYNMTILLYMPLAKTTFKNQLRNL